MSIFLRIKRPNTDCPSQICEAQNLIKRPKADLQSIQFKYIGSQTSNRSLIGKIDKVYTSSEKLCKIICNTSDATVVGENQTVKCQVSTLYLFLCMSVKNNVTHLTKCRFMCT